MYAQPLTTIPVWCLRGQYRVDVHRFLPNGSSRDGHNVAYMLLLVSRECLHESFQVWMLTCHRGSNIIVSSTFLSMMKSLTPSGAFGFYCAICFLGWILIILFYPEVSGLTLEEISTVFESRNPVSFARKLRKERKDVIKERMRTMEKPLAVGH